MKTSIFQMVLIGVFALAILAGVIVFALTKGKTDSINVINLTVWGTESESPMVPFFATFFQSQSDTHIIKYVQKNESIFYNDLLEALSRGTAPDVILISQDSLLQYKDKIFITPFETYPVRTFRDSFVEESELFVVPEGIAAFPFSIDPLVLYWNRDIFSQAGVATPPKFWDEVLFLTPRLTKRDAARNITSSAIALGNFSNVSNAKEVLSAMLLQVGNPIVSSSGGNYQSALAEMVGNFSGTASVLDFYSEFGNPLKSVYSWNPALPISKTMFTNGNLAMYIGFASDAYDIRAKNPNLNFDVTYLPQLRDAKTRVTFGSIKAFAILSSSKNKDKALTTISEVTGVNGIMLWTKLSGLPPVRRELLFSSGQNDPYQLIFSQSALSSRGWLDPNKTETNVIFSSLVEGVSSGRLPVQEAISNAERNLDDLLKPFQKNETI